MALFILIIALIVVIVYFGMLSFTQHLPNEASLFIGEAIILPLVGGVIGSLVTLYWEEIKRKKNLPIGMKVRYLFIGGVSGFVSVSLLNPEGSFYAKAALSILFGLSPVSFLKGQSFFDGKVEDDAFESYMSKYSDLFIDEMKDAILDDGELDEKSVAILLREKYTIGKGGDGSE